MAWLNTTPDKAEGDKSETPEIPRRKQHAIDGIPILMPPCRCVYLADYLPDIGPSLAGNAITHGEIESWQRNTGIELNAWEARTLRRLSIEYIRQSHDAKAKECPAPFGAEEIDPITAKTKTERVRSNLRALAGL